MWHLSTIPQAIYMYRLFALMERTVAARGRDVVGAGVDATYAGHDEIENVDGGGVNVNS